MCIDTNRKNRTLDVHWYRKSYSRVSETNGSIFRCSGTREFSTVQSDSEQTSHGFHLEGRWGVLSENERAWDELFAFGSRREWYLTSVYRSTEIEKDGQAIAGNRRAVPWTLIPIVTPWQYVHARARVPTRDEYSQWYTLYGYALQPGWSTCTMLPRIFPSLYIHRYFPTEPFYYWYVRSYVSQLFMYH